jgi:hypothetical protein
MIKPALNRKTIEKLDGLVNLRALGMQAGEEVKDEVRRILEEEGVSVRKVARRLNEALDANEQEAKLNKEGEFVYSVEMVAHKIRLEGVKLAADMLEMKEPEESNKTTVLIVDSFNNKEKKEEGEEIELGKLTEEDNRWER